MVAKLPRALTFGLLAAAIAGGAARAAVTLTDTTVDVKGETVPVYELENQWLKIDVIKDVTSAGSNSANGQVLNFIMKTSSQPTTSQLSIIQSSTPYVSQEKSYIAYRDRAGTSPSGGSVVDEQPGATVSGAMQSGVATVTVDETVATSSHTFTVQKIYRLRDNAKYMEVEYKWTNNGSTDYYRLDGNNTIDPLIYLVPGGSSGTNDPKDTIFMKTRTAFDSPVSTLTATNASNFYGGRLASGTNPSGFPSGNGQEPVEGWIGIIDPVANIDLVNTWDLAAQKAALPPASLTGTNVAHEVAVRGGLFGNRATFEVYWEYVPAGGTLDFTMYMIGDTDLKSVGFAKEGQLAAGISMDKSLYVTGATATATISLNSLDPANAATYDLKNIRVEDASTGAALTSITVPDITGVNVASNAHVVAGQPQITLSDPLMASDKQYVIKADLYTAGGTTPITTLISTPFVVGSDPVHLLKNTDGLYWLMNENVQLMMDPLSGQIKNLILLSNGRNQTVTSLPTYPMFVDYVNGKAVNPASVTLNPNKTDTATRKSIAFSASISNLGTFTKIYTLDSQSKAVQVDFKVANTGTGNTAIPGDVFYSQVPMDPGANAGTSDLFTTHTLNGFYYNSPAGAQKSWFGAMPDGTAGDQPEIDQPWMAAADRGATDALALSWDLAKQKQYSPKPDGSTPVTSNAIEVVGNYASQRGEVHFVNLGAGQTLSTTMYLMADTGFKLIGFAQGKEVMAGLWTDLSNNPSTANAYLGYQLPFYAGLTNTDTASHTYDLKNLKFVDTGSNTSTSAGADITGITLAAGAHTTINLYQPIPSSQAQSTYMLTADLYDGTTKLATLQTLPFNLVPAPNGDVDFNGVVNVLDVKKALSIAAGLEASDSGTVSEGDLAPTGGSGQLTIADAVAIAQKIAH